MQNQLLRQQLTLLSSSASSSHSSLGNHRLAEDNQQLGGTERRHKTSNSVSISISRHSSTTNYSTRSSVYAPAAMAVESSPVIKTSASVGECDGESGSSSIESASSLLERMQQMQLLQLQAALSAGAMREVEVEFEGGEERPDERSAMLSEDIPDTSNMPRADE